MKILIPADETDHYHLVLEFIGRLSFPHVEIRFLNVVAPACTSDMTFGTLPTIDGVDLISYEEKEAAKRMKVACRDSDSAGFPAKWQVEVGAPADVIQASADDFGADLIAIAAIPKSPMVRLLEGSVALTLAKECARDLLIVRRNHPSDKSCSVVFASDLSEGSSICLERLLSWKPKGITHVKVLTANDPIDHTSQITRLTQRFAVSGMPSDSSNVEGSVNDAIHKTMETTGADLLVLASHRHTFWETLIGRSTTTHEVATEPFSLLILRDQRVPQKKTAEIAEPAIA